MNREVRVHLGLASVAVVTISVVWMFAPTGNPWDWVFGVVVSTGLLTLVRLVVRAVHGARSAGREAARLATMSAIETTRVALAGERVRLATDIEALVRTSITTMLGLADRAAARWTDDPGPDLRSIGERGREATHELRRMLGLLREAEREQPSVSAVPSARTLPRGDLVLGAVTAAVAVAERFVYGEMDDPATPIGLAMTALAASAVSLRRAAPAAGAAVTGALFAVAATFDAAVTPGFWLLVSCGCLAWACASRADRRAAAGLLVLVVGTLGSMVVRDPSNAIITALILAVAALGGFVSGRAEARSAAAQDSAEKRRATLELARDEAVTSERLNVARELHDLVSHAVGVMTVQAGAAEVLHECSPDRAAAALEVVRDTGQVALVELDGLVAAIRDGAVDLSSPFGGVPRPAVPASGRGGDDIADVARRVGSAGLRVSVEVDAAGLLDTRPDLAEVSYRVVQEALTNTLRHGRASRATVSVRADAAGLDVTVTDDGCGPEPSAERGFGLVGLDERVRRVGGILSAATDPDDGGFRVHAWLPAVVPTGAANRVSP